MKYTSQKIPVAEHDESELAESYLVVIGEDEETSKMERPPVQFHPFWLLFHPPKDSALQIPCSKLTGKCWELKSTHLKVAKSEKYLCRMNVVINKTKYVFYR